MSSVYHQQFQAQDVTTGRFSKKNMYKGVTSIMEILIMTMNVVANYLLAKLKKAMYSNRCIKYLTSKSSSNMLEMHWN